MTGADSLAHLRKGKFGKCLNGFIDVIRFISTLELGAVDGFGAFCRYCRLQSAGIAESMTKHLPSSRIPLACVPLPASETASRHELAVTLGCTPEMCCCSPRHRSACPPGCLVRWDRLPKQRIHRKNLIAYISTNISNPFQNPHVKSNFTQVLFTFIYHSRQHNIKTPNITHISNECKDKV